MKSLLKSNANLVDQSPYCENMGDWYSETVKSSNLRKRLRDFISHMFRFLFTFWLRNWETEVSKIVSVICLICWCSFRSQIYRFCIEDFKIFVIFDLMVKVIFKTVQCSKIQWKLPRLTRESVSVFVLELN